MGYHETLPQEGTIEPNVTTFEVISYNDTLYSIPKRRTSQTKTSEQQQKIKINEKIRIFRERNNWFFEKIYNIDKPLAKVPIREKRPVIIKPEMKRRNANSYQCDTKSHKDIPKKYIPPNWEIKEKYMGF